jgi:hypothetical protein
MTKEFNLAGKDWFTEPEAAHYCGVSVRQFQGNYEALGIAPKRFMGRKLYSREELSAVITRADPWHEAVAGSGEAPRSAVTAKFCEALRKAKTQEEKDALFNSLGAYSRPSSPLDAYKPRRNRK